MSSPLLGLDIGLHRTGVALSESGLIAQPLTTLEWSYPHVHQLAAQLQELVLRHNIRTLIIGVPYSEDNSSNQQSDKTELIIQQLEASLRRSGNHLTIVRLTEFHSSQDAAELFPDSDRDAAAAAVILQDYLEQHGESW